MEIEHNSQSEIYRKPFGAVRSGEKITIRIALMDSGIPQYLKLVCEFKNDKKEYNMKYVFNIGKYYLYEIDITAPEHNGLLWYYFKININGHDVFYGNNKEMLGGIGEICDNVPNAYQITVFNKDFEVPKWFSGSVMYQIFPDRFYREGGEFLGNRKDIIKREWNEQPYYKTEQFGSEYLANDFFGGNLMGIYKKIPYLAELGIDVIYLNPIFKAFSNHRYDTGNYMEIDEILGDEETFCKLCDKASEYGIRIILDGVFNHTGSNSLYFNKNNTYDTVGAYQSKDSEYYDWYEFGNWPEKYRSWWGIKTLPAVNKESKEYRSYILNSDDSVVKHWLKKGASGWRLDVVDELSDDFVKELRREVKKQNKDAVIIGEVWEDASNKESYGEKREYLLGEELDSVMNYPLRKALIDIVTGKIDALEFDRRIMSIKENYPRTVYYSLMNFLSSHDVERILTVCDASPITDDKEFMANYKLKNYDLAKQKVKQLVIFQMLIPGTPSVFYGDEIGTEGYADPFCRKTFNWDNKDEDMLSWYKTAIGLRKSSIAFTEGEFENIYKYESGYGFIRYTKDEKYVVLLNFSNDDKCFRVDLARFSARYLSNEMFDEEYFSEDGIYYISMPKNSVKVFKAKFN